MKLYRALVFFAATLVSTTALARPSARLTLERDPAASSCPGEAQLREAVLERLGYDAFRREADTEIQVRFAADAAGGFSARIAQRDGKAALLGERVLTDVGSDCADIGEAVVLTITVMLESVSVPIRKDQPPTIAIALPTPKEHEQTLAGRRPPHLRLRSEGSVGIGLAPSPAMGLTLAAGVRSGALTIDLEGRADAPAEGAIPGGRVRTSLRMGQLVPCWHLGVFAGCGVVAGGAIAIEGVEVENARSETRFHALGGLRAAVEAPLGANIFLSVHADGLVALTRISAGIGPRDVYATAPFGALVAVGAGYAFP